MENKFYFAAPMYKEVNGILVPCEESRKLNKEIAKKLEEANIQLILPQRDVDQTLNPKELLEKELEIIKNCAGLIVLIGKTPGMWAEVGFARANNKKIIGLKTKDSWNLKWLDSFFDFITEDVNELIKHINSFK